MENSQPNENGVLLDCLIVQEYSDQFIEYSVRKSRFNDEEYFASSVLIKGFGIYSGISGPVSIFSQSTSEKEITFIKSFLQRELKNCALGLKHLAKLTIFQKTKQLSLFE